MRLASFSKSNGMSQNISPVLWQSKPIICFGFGKSCVTFSALVAHVQCFCPFDESFLPSQLTSLTGRPDQRKLGQDVMYYLPSLWCFCLCDESCLPSQLTSLTLDGLTGASQDKMRSEHRTGASSMMFSVNFWSILWLALGEFFLLFFLNFHS